ncbi:MAG: hypothetical protein ACREIC_32095 [Limisphaerales bacterium]
MKTLPALCLALVPLLSTMTSHGQSRDAIEITTSPSNPEQFERVELTLAGVPTATNPFDPDSISLDLDATGPSGRAVRVPGYFEQEFDRTIEGEREVLTPKG